MRRRRVGLLCEVINVAVSTFENAPKSSLRRDTGVGVRYTRLWNGEYPTRPLSIRRLMKIHRR